MRILGFEITRARADTGRDVAVVERQTNGLSMVGGRRGWFSLGYFPFVGDWKAGAWQRNLEYPCANGPFYADFACKTRIAQDFAKLQVQLVELKNDIWVKAEPNSAYDPLLRRPNHFQNPLQFWENWILSKLSSGNTYVLLQRDERRVVNAMFVLDYSRVRPLIADDGSIFYELDADNVSGIADQVIVPAREVIHDRMNCVHPLIGLPPIYASGLAQQQGLNIQNQSVRLYENNASPGGILTAPGEITQDDVDRARAQWEEKYSGPQNAGRIAVLGNGLKFEKLAVTAAEGQLIEQLKLTAEMVCSTYHVPPYKVGVGPLPSYNNVQSLNVEYYSQCLQYHIEAAEHCLDVGLGLANHLSIAFDIEGLLRMDSQARIIMLREAVQGGILSPNEARATLGYGPVDGGASPMTQQQNYSLAALAKRDAKADPFASAAPTPPSNGAGPDDQTNDDEDEDEDREEQRAALAQVAAWKLKELLSLRGPVGA